MVGSFYLILSTLVFTIGAFGVVIRRNMIIVLMCIELMLNAANIAFVNFSRQFNTIEGQVYVFFVIAIAAAEAAVGLALVIAIFRDYFTVETDHAATLQG